MSHDDRNDQFIEDLSIEARVLREARMLPMSGRLTKKHIEAVQKTYVGYAAEHGISDAEVAKQIGYSASVVNQWKRGKYDQGDEAAVTRAVNNWLERDARARQATLPLSYIPTKIAGDMRTIINIACTTRANAAIVAPSGCGKSLVLQAMADELRGFYMYVDEDHTPKEFLAELCRVLGISFYSQSRAALKRKIVDKLRGTNRPVMIDEGHLLQPQVFGRIRSIHDQTGVTFVLAGTSEILDRINDQANAKGQMASRWLRYNALDWVYDVETDPGSGKLGRALFTKDEVKKFFHQMKVRLDRGGFEMAWALACIPGHGCMRTVRRVFELVLMKWPGEEITRDRISKAMQLIHGSHGAYICNLAGQHIDRATRKAG